MLTYIYKDNEQHGPFEDEEVIVSLQNGSVSPDDLAWRDGFEEWTRLGSLYPSAERPRLRHHRSRQPHKPRNLCPSSRPRRSAKVSSSAGARLSKPSEYYSVLPSSALLLASHSLLSAGAWR
ncbi:MAG: DUF4339 domain-containing protein [Pyrinomonadaceae bacterium]|nr:DUF4339 domain-containing protein [Pyrinomonadaceae bacterium]